MTVSQHFQFQLLLLPPPQSLSSSSSSSASSSCPSPSLPLPCNSTPNYPSKTNIRYTFRTFSYCTYPTTKKKLRGGTTRVGKEDSELRVAQQTQEVGDVDDDDKEEEEDVEPTPEDLEYVSQIKRVLELLKKNRDMLFSEVRLTILIEDPREVERRRLLGIEQTDGPTTDDLVAALDEINEGKVPKDRLALKLLAEEMIQWPNLEVEAPKTKPSKSLYAKATDTGVDPQVAAKRLNIDWDSAAEIGDSEIEDETEVPSAVGYGALYLVTAFPVIIGISVVLILFYNSLQ